MKRTLLNAILIGVLLIAQQVKAEENQTLKELAPHKQAAIAKFVRLANNPKSPLGKRIAEINKETEDGRNHEGTIAMPITADSLQVVVVESENIYALWRYGEKKGNKCTATSTTTKFRIFLIAEQGVHSASFLSTYIFDMNTVETHSFTTSEEYCDIGSSGEAKDYKQVISVSAPTEIKIPAAN